MSFDLGSYLSRQTSLIDEALRSLLPAPDQLPPVIHEAMAYSLMAGGKRLRPILALAAAEAVQGYPVLSIMPAACALEMIHTYSLVHDDLPAMDNDDLRRGRPTSHRVFGEAMAILAGDALLTHAFLVMSQHLTECPTDRVVQAIAELALASGSLGMVGGQAADVLWEKRQISGDTKELLGFIHTHKTGCLFVASIRIGAILAGANELQLESLTLFAKSAGLAFQIADDLLDVTGDEQALGKRVGKDAALGKLTYPGVYGIDDSRAKNKELLNQALSSLAVFGSEAKPLREIACYLIERNR